MSEISFGKSFKIENGDLVFDAEGQLEFVEGLDNAVQTCKIILQTQFAEDPLAPVYGFDREGIFASELNTQETMEYAELKIKECLFQYDLVTEIYDVQVDISDRNMTIQMNVRFVDESEAKIGLEVIV